jgi:hypothetical protein
MIHFQQDGVDNVPKNKRSKGAAVPAALVVYTA